jgi:hypothetical protein
MAPNTRCGRVIDSPLRDYDRAVAMITRRHILLKMRRLVPCRRQRSSL